MISKPSDGSLILRFEFVGVNGRIEIKPQTVESTNGGDTRAEGLQYLPAGIAMLGRTKLPTSIYGYQGYEDMKRWIRLSFRVYLLHP